jgi:glucose-6-phosphate isomerase
VLWDINPFDQWGVELGKSICGDLIQAAPGSIPPELQPLLVWIAERR